MTLTPMTNEQLKNLDAMTNTVGLSTDILMERAGMALADFVANEVEEGEQVLLLCGKGNNGGDGYVAARHLAHKNITLTVMMSGEPKSGHSKKNKKLFEHMGFDVTQCTENTDFSSYTLIIDCLLGYGQKGTPRQDVISIMKQVNESHKKVIACDVPTGIDMSTGTVHENCIKATKTLSYAAPKNVFENENVKEVCGEISITGLGIPQFVYELIIPQGAYLIEGTQKL